MTEKLKRSHSPLICLARANLVFVKSNANECSAYEYTEIVAWFDGKTINNLQVMH